MHRRKMIRCHRWSLPRKLSRMSCLRRSCCFRCRTRLMCCLPMTLHSGFPPPSAPPPQQQPRPQPVSAGHSQRSPPSSPRGSHSAPPPGLHTPPAWTPAFSAPPPAWSSDPGSLSLCLPGPEAAAGHRYVHLIYTQPCSQNLWPTGASL